MAQASATPAEAATAVEAEVQRVLSGRGAAGDVPARAGRSLSDRAGDARRPLSRTLKQLGPPSENGPTLAVLGLYSLLRPHPGADGGRRLPPESRGCGGHSSEVRGKTRPSRPAAPPSGPAHVSVSLSGSCRATRLRPSGDASRKGLPGASQTLDHCSGCPVDPTHRISIGQTPFRPSSLPGRCHGTPRPSTPP